MAISLIDEKNTVYGKGDVCLKISPFDNFRKFTLYENWKNDDRKTIDISNGPKIYLVFKTKKKEIRIPEYTEYDVDKVNGEVMFKITKKNAIDILSLSDHTFYITRIYETTDMSGDNVTSSDEEVLYAGQWKDESSSEVESYTEKIKTLLAMLEDRNQQIKDLQSSNAALMEQNVNFAAQIEDYKDTVDSLNNEINTLETKVATYESGEIYEGKVLSDDGTMVYVDTSSAKDLNMTEEQWGQAIKKGLQETLKQ